MRVYGIDASLSSTGICVADCNFNAKYAKNLLTILLNRDIITEKDKNAFRKCFRVVASDQIVFSKKETKELAKIRKKIKTDMDIGQVLSADIVELEDRVIQRMKFQIDNICAFHQAHKPDISFIEDYSYNSKGSVIQLAEMKGFLKATKNFNMFIAPIGSIKKIGSGNGNANKHVMYDGISRYPLDGVLLDEDRDDEIDAIAICLMVYYGIYYRVVGFDFPEVKTTEEKTKIKAWISCLDKTANHIGSSIELKDLINEK